MKQNAPQLSLILQHIDVSNDSGLTRVLQVSVRRVVEELVSSGLWVWPLDVCTKGHERSKRTIDSLEQLIQEVTQRSADRVVLTDHTGCATEVEISIRNQDMAMYCTSPLGLLAHEDLLGRLTHVGTRLWEVIRSVATVGPVFSIRPIELDYPRPLPPRQSNVWLLGDAAYFISHSFHETSPIGDPKGAARLRSAKLPNELLRDTQEELTVIQCKGPAEDTNAFWRQLLELELWMSSVLRLPVHPEFRENGDQRVGVVRKESADPFTFYDHMLGIAFKAVPETEPRTLDADTRRELAEMLRVRTLANGRNVRQTIVVFPTRDAAVYNQDVVSELGASGAVYVGDDGCLWNPKPKGNWIPADWNKEQ